MSARRLRKSSEASWSMKTTEMRTFSEQYLQNTVKIACTTGFEIWSGGRISAAESSACAAGAALRIAGASAVTTAPERGRRRIAPAASSSSSVNLTVLRLMRYFSLRSRSLGSFEPAG